MIHAFGSDDIDERLQNDAQVQQERAMLQVVGVQFDLLWNGQFVPTVDLRPSGQARGQHMHALLRAPQSSSKRRQALLVRPHACAHGAEHEQERKTLGKWEDDVQDIVLTFYVARAGRTDRDCSISRR